MIELAVVERYIYTILGGIGTAQGVDVRLAPFNLANQQSVEYDFVVPVLYWRYHTGQDVNALGPGPRVMTSAVYEIGVFSDAVTFGVNFESDGGSVTLLELLQAIDDGFQNYSTPSNQVGGTVFSVQRESPVRIPERGVDGRIYTRNGGLYRFAAQAGA